MRDKLKPELKPEAIAIINQFESYTEQKIAKALLQNRKLLFAQGLFSREQMERLREGAYYEGYQQGRNNLKPDFKPLKE